MIRESTFRPPRWFRNPHLQTLWPVLFKPRPKLPLQRERLELPDGDFLDLDWGPVRQGPLVLVLHGLEGSIRSHYASAIMHALIEAGYTAVLMHFRGCSGEPNRLPRAYTAGDTVDLAQVVEVISSRYPGKPLAAIGYSLGGNALLKWLGQTRDANPLTTAVAVSVPFDLSAGARRMKKGFSRLYQRHLVGRLKRTIQRKQRLGLMGRDHQPSRLRNLHTFLEFDDAITAPLHGYRDVHHYYGDASSRQYLKDISRPTLILHAEDDPFMFPDSVPNAEELSATTELELARYGGHVGFVAHPLRMKQHGWVEKSVLDWLHRHI
ncbi:MAG: hydrolase [Gammaproteobacteria bacterium]|jgi:predicted alpha/beta-fold hydrolase